MPFIYKTRTVVVKTYLGPTVDNYGHNSILLDSVEQWPEIERGATRELSKEDVEKLTKEKDV